MSLEGKDLGISSKVNTLNSKLKLKHVLLEFYPYYGNDDGGCSYRDSNLCMLFKTDINPKFLRLFKGYNICDTAYS